MREAQLDPKLSRYSTIILDEAHERTIHLDLLCGLTKGTSSTSSTCPVCCGWLIRVAIRIFRAARVMTNTSDALFFAALLASRPELRVVIMSATLDTALFSSFFGAPTLSIPGRQFPVEVFYTKEPQEDYLEAALIAVLQVPFVIAFILVCLLFSCTHTHTFTHIVSHTL